VAKVFRHGFYWPTALKNAEDLVRKCNGTLVRKVDGLEVLTAPFTTEEMDNVIAKMPPDKASGPDGFDGLISEEMLGNCEGKFLQAR
jgi:hypothetical protein